MNIQVQKTAQQGARVVVSGEVDVSNAEDLRVQIDAALADDAVEQVEVDMAEVSYIDSTGIGVLVGAAHRAQEAGRGFKVLNPQANVLRILGLLGVDEVLGLK
jgi:anti-sigma B factor antagonist